MNKFELTVYGYSGRVIETQVFNSLNDAQEYRKCEFGGDGGLSYEIEKVDKNGNSVVVEK